MNTHTHQNSIIKSLVLGIAIFAMAVMAIGCATNKQVSGRPLDDQKIARIVKGQTTVEEVIEMFGAPQSQSEMGGNILYVYTHSQTKGSTAFMPYYTSGNSKTTSDELTITFDKETARVKTYSLQRGIGA